MIGLFLGEKKLPIEILIKLKKKKLNILLLIYQKIINLKKIKIVILLVLENLVEF